MTYVINNYDGTTLVSIADRTVNTTRTSIKLPGRDYPRYGEPVVENLVWMLQHFAAPSEPSNPITGQVWYDTNSQSLRVYNGAAWIGTGKTVTGSGFPISGELGQVFYNTAKRQMYVYDPAQTPIPWKLIGPIGAYDNSDPANPLPGFTSMEAATVVDTSSITRSIIKIVVKGQLVAVFSNDPSFAVTTLPGFTTILPGLNLSSTLSAVFNGSAVSAQTAGNSSQLGGAAASTYMRKDQSNIPTLDASFDLGSTAQRLANVYVVTFNGVATSARYADLAERYHCDETANPGRLVSIGGKEEVTLCRHKGSTDVLGVISTAPGLMLNSEAGDNLTHPYVALAGRVPVMVIGSVQKGQRLMASGYDGLACAWQEEFGILAIVGRSLQTKQDHGIGTVEAVVGTK